MRPSWTLLGWAAILSALVALWLRARLRRALAGRRARRRGGRAVRGERDAEPLLEACGYRILDRQAAISWIVECDGEPLVVELRADLLVERGGARYVAEVKTGQVAPSLASAATRRQLLEYYLAYDVDGVLLVDVEAGDVLDVRFTGPRQWPGADRLLDASSSYL